MAGCHGDAAKGIDAAIDGSALADSSIDAPPDVASDALSVISYVQGASSYRSTATYPSATLTQPTTAGNLLVVAISWYAVSASVFKINDGAGNTYTGATGTATQSYHLAMYYAANVAPATTISVTMTGTVSSADVRVAEYSGLATTAPFELASSGAGQGTTASTGALITTHPHDLLVTATGLSNTAGPGAGFTQRLLENANILEDQEVTIAGGHTGTAAMNDNGLYLIGIMALKAAD